MTNKPITDYNPTPINVFMEQCSMDHDTVLKIIKDPIIELDDEPTFAIIDETFHNGTIEVDVYSDLLKSAPDHARGFIGVTFRIDETDQTFEGIYIRPTNSQASSQLRRNRSTQYFSYPNFKYDALRKIAPGEYESYVDIDLKQWIHLKINVHNQQATLFVNHAKHPSLIVNDLKLGENQKGKIGLWVDIGTRGFFKNLHIVHE